MSAYINTVCARVTNTLLRLNKEVLANSDVIEALKDAGIVSRIGVMNYTKTYLIDGGYLIRCIGGWTIAPDACTTTTISIKVTPGLIVDRVHQQVTKAARQFEGIAEIRIEE